LPLISRAAARECIYVRHRLEKQGFATAAVSDGQAGIDAARRDRPDLIVLDLCLPDVDGFQVCEELGDGSNTCGIPIIMLSAMERPDIIRRSRSVGCQYYLRKPYDPNALLLLIEHSLHGM
jgi:DNA-binding response OmpR family regulator